MPELLCHLIGDYILQNHWMALNKTRSGVACLIHVVLYTLPFLVLTRSPAALALILGTHFAIDRWSLARRWPAFWGVGEPGWVCRKIHAMRRHLSVSDRIFRGNQTCAEIGEQLGREFDAGHPLPDPAPPFLAVWLAIIVDNTAHLLINHVALAIS